VYLTVYDISPDTAYQIVNAVLDILNKKVLSVQKEKAMEVVEMWEMQLTIKKHKIDSMSTISKQLSQQYGLLDYPSQSKEVSKAYYQALAGGKGSKQFDEIALQMKNMQEHGIDFREINWQIETAVSEYNKMESQYEDAMKDVNKQFTYWNLVSTPYIPDSYCYPLRTIIVLGTCLAAFVFSILFIRGAEKIRAARMSRSEGQ
jgi:capsule polysaccharide export protein KpsE/RkpR